MAYKLIKNNNNDKFESLSVIFPSKKDILNIV